MKVNIYPKKSWENIALHSPILATSNFESSCFCPAQLLPENDRDRDRHLRVAVEQKATQGDYPGAIALLARLLQINPNSASDRNNRGLMYFRNGQIEEAIADLSKAIELNPRLDSAYNNRANCYAAKGERIAAIADYEIALDLNPGNIRAWINQGITFREMELYDLAIESFDLALILGKRLKGRIYAERGKTYHLRGDWNCAVADYGRALKELSGKTNQNQYRQQIENHLAQLLNPLSA